MRTRRPLIYLPPLNVTVDNGRIRPPANHTRLTNSIDEQCFFSCPAFPLPFLINLCSHFIHGRDDQSARNTETRGVSRWRRSSLDLVNLGGEHLLKRKNWICLYPPEGPMIRFSGRVIFKCEERADEASNSDR